LLTFGSTSLAQRACVVPRKREVAPMDPATLETTIKGHLKEMRERLDHAASIARAA